MSISTPARLARLVLAVLALALAATAVTPAVSGAQPNQGGGSGDSDYCKTLRDRLQRYHDIATDTAQPKGVRDFYRARANVLLMTARKAGCTWAARVSAGAGVATAPPETAATTRQRARFDRLAAPRRGFARGAQRRAAGGTTQAPPSQPSVAAIKAHPTGNSQQDEYCAAVGQLIDEAEREGDNAALRGDEASADAWYDLADEFIDRATQNGCRFTLALTAQRGTRQLRPGVATRG